MAFKHPPSRLMSAHEVTQSVSYSLQHLRRLEADGKFPKRVRLGANRIGWVRQEVEDWLAARMLERTSNKAQTCNI